MAGRLRMSWRLGKVAAVVGSAVAVVASGSNLADASITFGNTEYVLIDSVHVGSPVLTTHSDCEGYVDHGLPVVPVTVEATFVTTDGEDPTGPYGGLLDWSGGLVGAPDDHFGGPQASNPTQFFHTRAYAQAGSFGGAGEYTVDAFAQDVGLAGGYADVQRTFDLPGLPPGGGEAEVKCPFTGPFDLGDFLSGMAKSAAEDIADEIAKETLPVAAAKAAYDAVKKILYYNDLFNSTLENSVVDDPPDHNYQQVEAPQPAPLLSPPDGLSSDQQTAFVDLEQALATDIGLTRALEAAENRSWGAENAGSRYWYRQQVQQQGSVADQLATAVGDLDQLYANFQAAMSPDLPTVPVSVKDSLDYQVQVAKALPADEADVLSQLGATTADESRIVDAVVSLDAGKLTTDDARNALFQQNDAGLAGPLRGMAQWARDALKAPPPVVADVSPHTIDEGGGTEVTITGSNLASVTGIDFGPSSPMTGEAQSVNCTDTQCTAVAPPGTGTVDVMAVGPGGPSATVPGDQVTYAVPPKPQVTHVYPDTGPIAGGTQVSISGSGLANGTVYFGPTPSDSATCTDSHCTAYAPSFAAPGSVDVQVATGGGTSDPSAADTFDYTATSPPAPGVPTVTGVAPASGTDLGGETVTISGSNFTGANAVLFGPDDASSYQVVDDGTITAVAPPSYQAGTVDVQVTGPAGTSETSTADRFTYQSQKPAITSVTPASGPDIGGTTVTIHGSNLGYGDAGDIDIGTGYIADAVCSGDSCTGTTPPGPDGPADVTLYNDDGSARLAGGFTYLKGPQPVVTSVAPDTGPVAGGDPVVVSGTDLSAGTVSFGGNRADGTCTETTCVVTAPRADKGGPVDVQVTTNAGTSAVTAADSYSYVHLATPVVDSVDPASGYLAGYDEVRITGTDLTDGAVSFGGVPADGTCTFSQCVVRSPAATGQGPVVVTVATDSGESSSTASAGNEFSYVAPAVTGVSPTSGWTAGGTKLTITGTNFPGTAQEPASDVEIEFGSDSQQASGSCDGTTCTVTTPKVPDTTGAVDLRVRTEYGTESPVATADRFTYFKRPAPTVTSISPTSGSDIGGDQVTIDGADLDGGSVKFGTLSARNVTCGHTSCTATSPYPNADAAMDVTVTTPAGTSATSSADQFTFAPPGAPSITSIDPGSGSIVGGTPVTISGQNLTGGAVTFGGKSASGVTCFATACTVTAPSQPTPQQVSVVVTTHGLHSGGGTANSPYTYVTPPAPAVTGVDPTTGPMSGGTPFTVTGTDFAGGAVKVGGIAATTVTCTATRCTGVTPAGSTGAADVTVTTPGGTSATSSVDTFTYSPVDITEHAIPGVTSGTGGGGIVRAPNGDIWFDISNQDLIGRVSATDGTITTYPAAKPTGFTGSALDPLGITVGPDGRIWYCERNTDLIVAIDNSGNQQQFQVPGSAGVPGAGIGDMRFLTSGPDGRIWFTLGHSSAIGALDPNTGSVSEFRLPNPYVLPYNIVSGPDGRLWFTEVYGDDIGAITTSGKITEYPLPDKGPWAWGLTVGSDNRLWFGDTMARNVGAITTDGAVTTYPVPNELDDPQGVISGSDGRLWFTAPDHDTINALDPATGDVTEYAMPPGYPAGEAPRYLAMGSDGTLWVTENEGKNLLSVQGIGGGSGPRVAALTPDHGAAGASVVISGSGFEGASGVSFGGTPAASFTVTDPSHITATVPSGSGLVDVTVTGPAGTSTTTPSDQFNYGAAIPATPNVTGVSPDTGSTSGGTTVTITGQHLAGGTVSFGGAAATGVSCSDTTCTATSPPGAAGEVDVTVTTGAGASSITGSDQFVYQTPPPPAPVVTSVSPSSGSDAGGTPVTVAGDHLSGGAVRFGLEAAGDAQCTDTQCTVTSPAGGAGPVDVRVETAGGTSARSDVDQFTFVATTKRPVTVTATVAAPNFGYSSQSESFTADISPAIAGDVQFEVDGSPLGSPVHVMGGNGHASSPYFTGPSQGRYFAVGNHPVTAEFTPTDSSYYAVSDGHSSFTVTKATTTTTLGTFSPSPVAGQPIYLYASVQPYAAAGTVQFEDGSTPLGDPVTVSSGTAHYQGTLAAGLHHLHAVFTPSDPASYSPSTGDLTLTVAGGGSSGDPSAATLSVPKAAAYGASVTASTKLTDTTSGSPIAGASVVLEQRTAASAPWTSIGTATTSATGSASVRFTAKASGQLQWVYGGDTAHQQVTSAVRALSVSQVVSIAATRTKLRHGMVVEFYGSVRPGRTGQRVTLQVEVGNTWKAVSTAKLTRQRLPNRKTALSYVFRAKVAKRGRQAFRVVVAKAGGLAAGRSKPVRITAT